MTRAIKNAGMIMMTFMISIILIGFPVQSIAQKQIDSLLSVLQATKEDTSRFRILDALCYRLMYLAEYDKAAAYANEMKSLAEKLIPGTSDPKMVKWLKQGLGNSYLNMGKILMQQGNFPKAAGNFSEAQKIYGEIGSKRGSANAFYFIGITLAQEGNFPGALSNLAKAEKLYDELEEKNGIATIYSARANIHHVQGNYPEALKNYFAGLKISEELQKKNDIGAIYMNIGILYDEQGNYEEAMKNYAASLKLFQELGDKKGIALTYDNIGFVNYEKANYPDAMENFIKSKEVSKNIGDQYTYALACLHIGFVYHKWGNDADALTNYFASLKIAGEINDPNTLASCYEGIGASYAAQEKYSQSIDYLNKALLLAKEMGYKEIVKESYEELSKTYEKMGDYKNAFKYHQLLMETKDSLFSEQKSKQITEMKAQYESDKKEKEIALLTKDKELQSAEINKQKIQKYSFIGGLALFVFLSFFVYNNYRTRQKLKVQTLRNKIASDLHDDIGSTLTSIRLYSEIARKQTTDQHLSGVLDKIGQNASDMIHSMSDIVWTINPKYDTFASVLSRMESFASEILSPQEIEYTIEKENEVEDMKLSMEERQNIFLIFKEAIHNAAKHAACRRVMIHLSRDNNHLQMRITDDGSGFDEQSIQRGNGLSNMEHRAAKISGIITVTATPGKGTSVTLNMTA